MTCARKGKGRKNGIEKTIDKRKGEGMGRMGKNGKRKTKEIERKGREGKRGEEKRRKWN
jgi:hypothetical protein